MAVFNETEDVQPKSPNPTRFLQKAWNYKWLLLFIVTVQIIFLLTFSTNFFTVHVRKLWRIKTIEIPQSASRMMYVVQNDSSRDGIVHFIVDSSNFNLNDHHFLSVLSAIRIFAPKQIMFHAVVWPWEESRWYRVIRQVSPRVVFKNVKDGITPFKFAGNLNDKYKIALKKLSILKNYGGIILNLATVLLGSIGSPDNELCGLSRDCVILSDSLTFSDKYSIFLNEWYTAAIEAPSKSALIKCLEEYPKQLTKSNITFANEAAVKSLMHKLKPVNSQQLGSLRATNVAERFRYILDNRTVPSQSLVPRLVHFFWNKASTTDLSFLECMSIRSAYRFYKPTQILFYIMPRSESPVGLYWNTTLELEQIEVVTLKEADFTGQTLEDIKVYILERKGGIFLHLSVIVVNDIEFLRAFDGVISFDGGKHYGDEFIMMKPGYKYKTIVEQLRNPSRTTAARDSVFSTSDTVCWGQGYCQINSKDSTMLSHVYNIDSLFYITFDSNKSNSYDANTIQTLNSTFGDAVRLSVNGFSNVLTPQHYVVPNIVHYVWLGKSRTFALINLISVYSAYIMQNPEKICIHHDNVPIGPWWEKVQKVVPVIEMVKIVAPDSINGKPIRVFIEHRADVARLQILLEQGGIYIDTDVFVLRSVDPLRMHPYTVAKESAHNGLANSIILASSDSEFLHMFYDSYRTNFRDNEWAYNSIILHFQLALNARPDKIAIGPSNRMIEPGWEKCNLLFGENTYRYWKDNYFVHLWNKACPDKAQMQVWETAMCSHQNRNSLVGKISQYFFDRFQNAYDSDSSQKD